LPAGENPPPGAIVDYYLASQASGEVTLEFLNSEGKVVRRYSTADPVRSPDPATDPATYNKLCQLTPNAPDCGLPLYWPAPQQQLKTSAGMHRFTWDLHYDALAFGGGGGRGGGGGVAAVPHRTYPNPNSPWVAPGVYTVRLTANGMSRTQPIVVKMDPRVKITPEVQQIFTLTTRLENDAGNIASAETEALALIDKIKARPESAVNDAIVKELVSLTFTEPAATESAAGRGGRGGRGPAANANGEQNLRAVGAQLIAAAMGMQGSEMPPTAAQLEACRAAETAYTNLLQKLSALKARVNGPAPAKPATSPAAAKRSAAQ
jgi:hypothetical protein